MDRETRGNWYDLPFRSTPLMEPRSRSSGWYSARLSSLKCAATRRLRVLAQSGVRSEEHTSELQSRQYLHSFPTRRSSDLVPACCEVVVSGYSLHQWIGRPEETGMISPSDLRR